MTSTNELGSAKPTNIDLYTMDKVNWNLMIPVESADVTEGMSNNLHPEGLYSVEIFGRVGTDIRDNTESYINLKLPVFIPTIYKVLVQLKSLYGGILKGSDYAIWDKADNDFIKSNMLDGRTGFSFFMEHWDELDIKLTDSFKRSQKLDFIKKFKTKAMIDKLIVIPAGLRDIQLQPDGGFLEVELNDLYRKLLFKARSVGGSDINNPMYNDVRWGIQTVVNAIDDYIFQMLDGKKGFIQAKVSTRGVVNGTRNVISARKISIDDADSDNGVSVNTTDIGLYQGLLSFQYVCKYALLNGFINNVFTIGNNNVKLINTKTLEAEYVEVKNDVMDKWTSSEGLTKLFNGFNNREIRFKPIILSGHYLGLVYDDGVDIKVMRDINELPEGKNKKFVTPLTYIELYYIYCHEVIESKLIQVTRHPITGIGSIYPSKPIVKTLTRTEHRRILGDDWELIKTCLYYPSKRDEHNFFDAMSVDPSKEKLLGSDHDGDQLNANAINSADSIAECLSLLGRREYYISGNNSFSYEPTVETHDFLFKALSTGLN